MARITIEDCLQKINNRFRLIHAAANRVRQLRKGAEPLVVAKNRDIVIALREVAAGHISPRERTEGPELLESPLEELLLEVPEPEDAEAPSPEATAGEAAPAAEEAETDKGPESQS